MDDILRAKLIEAYNGIDEVTEEELAQAKALANFHNANDPITVGVLASDIHKLGFEKVAKAFEVACLTAKMFK